MWFQDNRAKKPYWRHKGEQYEYRIEHGEEGNPDKLESEIKAAAAKLETLKAEAETAKADFEIKAITELLTKQHEILHHLREARK